jgi:hypothetical protein
MIWTRSPKALCDHCIELEALIRLISVNMIYATNGQVPETIMTGTTADISHISEFGWYDWVMFRDNTPTFPEDNIVLGQYLGPATDVGGMMTAKILKENGQFIYHSTLQHLTKEETDGPAHKDMRRRFDKSIEDILGPGTADTDFDPEDLTPKYRPYDEDFDFGIKGKDDTPPEEVTPETGDSYLNAEISLSKGGTLARGQVVQQKRDADGIPTGKASSNPVLDTRTYEVEFDNGDVTEFTANMIAQAMYAQCDIDGNQYLLLDQFVDHRKDDTAITLTKQTVHHDNGRTYRRKTTAGWQICCQ